MRKLLLTLFIGELWLSAQTNEMSIKTEVSNVTVFINGAQVVRKTFVDIPKGTSVLKFTNLSPYIDAKSIQVKVTDAVMLLSVNHQFNYLDSLKRSQEVAALNDQLKAVEKKIALENVNIDIVNEELDFLKENRSIGGKNQELSLNNFKQTADFYRDRIAAAKLKLVELNANLEKLLLEKENIEKQINQLASNKPLPTSEVLAKVLTNEPMRVEVELSYFVTNAGWFPSYDIRVKSIDEPVQLVYKANVRQSTREEWKNIRLKLSSADPQLGNVAPILKTYYLDYHLAPPRYSSFSGQVTGKVLAADTHEPLVGATVTVKGTTIGTITDANGNYSLTLPANNAELQASYVGYQSQTLSANQSTINFYLQPSEANLDEVVVIGYGNARKAAASVSKQNKGTLKASSLPLPVVQTENNTAIEFEILTPYTLPSDNKNLSVDIETYLMDAAYEYYAVPKIDRSAFLVAHIVDWEKYNLLAGEANIFFENTYVGKSIIDVRSLADTLSLSLGIDRQVQIKRDKLKDFTKKRLLGSKKEETRAWIISVRNSKKQAIRLKLYDQVPVSTNSEIEVVVEELSGGILKTETGEVMWDIQLEPLGKKELQLRYTVKYPRNRNLIVE